MRNFLEDVEDSLLLNAAPLTHYLKCRLGTGSNFPASISLSHLEVAPSKKFKLLPLHFDHCSTSRGSIPLQFTSPQNLSLKFMSLPPTSSNELNRNVFIGMRSMRRLHHNNVSAINTQPQAISLFSSFARMLRTLEYLNPLPLPLTIFL